MYSIPRKYYNALILFTVAFVFCVGFALGHPAHARGEVLPKYCTHPQEELDSFKCDNFKQLKVEMERSKALLQKVIDDAKRVQDWAEKNSKP